MMSASCRTSGEISPSFTALATVTGSVNTSQIVALATIAATSGGFDDGGGTLQRRQPIGEQETPIDLEQTDVRGETTAGFGDVDACHGGDSKGFFGSGRLAPGGIVSYQHDLLA